MTNIKIWQRTSQRQHGMATFETVLVLPVIFFFLLLIFQSIKASWLWLDRVIDARNSAWQTELYFASDTSNSELLLTAQALTNPVERYEALTTGNVQSVKAQNTIGFSVGAREDLQSRNAEQIADRVLVAEQWLQDVRKIPGNVQGNLDIGVLSAEIDTTQPGGVTGIAYSPKQRIGFIRTMDERAEAAMANALLSVIRGGDMKEVLRDFAGEFVRREQHLSDFSQGWRIDPVANPTEGHDNPLKQKLGNGSEFLDHIK